LIIVLAFLKLIPCFNYTKKWGFYLWDWRQSHKSGFRPAFFDI